MLLPIIILIYISLLLLICAAATRIKKKEIRYPATWYEEKQIEVKQTNPIIDDCLEELGDGRG